MNDYSQLMNEYSFCLLFNVRLYRNSLSYAESCIYSLIVAMVKNHMNCLLHIT